MADEHLEERKRWDKLKDRYIISITHGDTYAHKYVWKLTPLTIAIIIFGILAVTAFLSAAFVFFTPIKEWIPGYQDISDQRPFLQLQREIKRLEEEVRKRDLYINAYKARLSGEVETEADAMKKAVPTMSKKGIVAKIKEDDRLRADFVRRHEERKVLKVLSGKGKKGISDIYFTPPVKGQVSASYMTGKKHYGVDIIAVKNTPVLATLPGYVISADWTINTGYTIAIQHDNNLVSFYKHNSSLLKQVGDRVQAGEAIAIIGNSGVLTSGPHLHFELWYNGKPLDPEDYLVFD